MYNNMNATTIHYSVKHITLIALQILYLIISYNIIIDMHAPGGPVVYNDRPDVYSELDGQDEVGNELLLFLVI